MTTPPPNQPDPTMPVPTGGEPTAPVPPVGPGGDPTVPVQGESFGGGTGGPGGTGQDDDDEGGDNRMWWIAGGLIAAGIIIAIIILLLSSGGDDDSGDTTTTSSSTTSSTTTTTAPTTTTVPPTTAPPAGPQINQFTVNDGSVSCPDTTQITLTWSTTNALNVTVSIDNPNGPVRQLPRRREPAVPVRLRWWARRRPAHLLPAGQRLRWPEHPEPAHGERVVPAADDREHRRRTSPARCLAAGLPAGNLGVLLVSATPRRPDLRAQEAIRCPTSRSS